MEYLHYSHNVFGSPLFALCSLHHAPFPLPFIKRIASLLFKKPVKVWIFPANDGKRDAIPSVQKTCKGLDFPCH